MSEEDQRLEEELKKHSSEDLRAFRNKLRLHDNPRAWAIRFHIVRILLARHLFEQED